jgi:hypothetical protein
MARQDPFEFVVVVFRRPYLDGRIGRTGRQQFGIRTQETPGEIFWMGVEHGDGL